MANFLYLGDRFNDYYAIYNIGYYIVECIPNDLGNGNLGWYSYRFERRIKYPV